MVPAHQAAPWVARSQSHIVVTINYRLSIMGFPNAAGVEDQNLGLLDQRAALEWVRDNIQHFGGDPSKILLWGFSAGAQSIDFHNYAYWEDPIAHAHFAQSGSVLAFGSGQAEDHTKFTYVARQLGCDYAINAADELECMQHLDYHDIINFIGRHTGEPRLRFGPITDEKVVFADYKERYALGKVTQAPMIYSSCSNDGSTLAGYDANHPENGPNQAMVDITTKRIMCGAAESSKLREEYSMTTYRYQYAGDWPNQNPLEWMGAYHSSDLVMLFGTHEHGTGLSSTPLETETSLRMQDFLLAFMNDPHNGPKELGWPAFEPMAIGGGTMIRFGANGKAVQNVSGSNVEGVCSGQGQYKPFP